MIISRGQSDQNDENEEPVSEDKIKEKWTDEMIQDEIEKGTRDYIGCGSSSNPLYRLILLRVSFRNKRNNSPCLSTLSSVTSLFILCVIFVVPHYKVGRLADATKPQCAICRRSFTSIAYLKSHMRAHKMPLRCKGIIVRVDHDMLI